MQRFITLVVLISIAFLWQGCKTSNTSVPVHLVNSLDQERTDEIISFKINELQSRFPELKMEQLRVKDSSNANWLISQLIDNNQDGNPDEFIFQTSFLPLEQKTVILTDEQIKRPAHNNKAYATFVPQRKDDFAWENDRIAFRMYGPALEAEGEISSGVDVWVKSVPDLILDKWYQPGYNYHKNQGEGLDYYKVGPSRGCGGTAFWDGKNLLPSNNFTNWKIITNGPLRTIFELEYESWKFKELNISETKRIFLDAGSNLNRFESHYLVSENVESLPIAIGIVKRENPGVSLYKPDEGWFGYWEPEHITNGSTACGIVTPSENNEEFLESDSHFLFISQAHINQPFVYYAGAGWSGNSAFKDAESWNAYLKNFSLRLKSPIEIQF